MMFPQTMSQLVRTRPMSGVWSSPSLVLPQAVIFKNLVSVKGEEQLQISLSLFVRFKPLWFLCRGEIYPHNVCVLYGHCYVQFHGFSPFHFLHFTCLFLPLVRFDSCHNFLHLVGFLVFASEMNFPSSNVSFCCQVHITWL